MVNELIVPRAPSVTSAQAGHDIGRRKPGHGNDFVTGGMPSHQLHGTARTIERVRQQTEQGVIRRGIDGRGRHLDLQLASERLADFILRCVRLEFDSQENPPIPSS